jgi:HlyD family secretion protein
MSARIPPKRPDRLAASFITGVDHADAPPPQARPAQPPQGPRRPADGARLHREMRRIGLAGGLAMVALVGALGGWAATTEIGGAVIAAGQAVVHGKPQTVQSLDGGIIAEINVKDGDLVNAGDVLVRLDPTLLKINLDSARTRLADALALKARLTAEQLGQETLRFDYPDLPFPPLDTAQFEEGQRKIFKARAQVRDGRAEQLAERLDQFENQLAGIRAQIAAKRDQLGFLEKDLDSIRILTEEGLARQSQMTTLQRDRSDLLGQIASLESDMARIRNEMRDAEIETLQAERSFQEGVVTELREVTATTEELLLEIVTRTAQLDRIEVRAPADGVVHEMQVATLGGVVAPGGTILSVVPLGRGVDFDLRVDPRAIDQVYPGQKAQVIFSAFDPRNAPRLIGEVTTVSPDAVTDPRTGQEFFRIGLSVPPTELARLGDVKLVPGMPVEAFLETTDRTVMSYLLHPLSSQLTRAFRED